MDKKTFKKIMEQVGYSSSSVKSLRSGRMKPTYSLMVELDKEYGIPFDKWLDIREFLKKS